MNCPLLHCSFDTDTLFLRSWSANQWCFYLVPAASNVKTEDIEPSQGSTSHFSLNRRLFVAQPWNDLILYRNPGGRRVVEKASYCSNEPPLDTLEQVCANSVHKSGTGETQSDIVPQQIVIYHRLSGLCASRCILRRLGHLLVGIRTRLSPFGFCRLVLAASLILLWRMF